MKSFITIVLLQMQFRLYVAENKIDKSYTMHEADQECIYDSGRKPEGKSPLRKRKVDLRIIMKLDSTRRGWIIWTGFILFRTQSNDGHF